MKKSNILVLMLIVLSIGLVKAQQPKVTIYNPEADARANIQTAVIKASSENKQVLLQIGGNWCPWCVKLHKLFFTDTAIDSLLKADYVFMMVNYSSENKNLAVLKDLEYPQRFGFPVLVVLNKDGKRIHTQDTGLLESGDGYDAKKVFDFLKGWNVAAFNPVKYQ